MIDAKKMWETIQRERTLEGDLVNAGDYDRAFEICKGLEGKIIPPDKPKGQLLITLPDGQIYRAYEFEHHTVPAKPYDPMEPYHPLNQRGRTITKERFRYIIVKNGNSYGFEITVGHKGIPFPPISKGLTQKNIVKEDQVIGLENDLLKTNSYNDATSIAGRFGGRMERIEGNFFQINEVIPLINKNGFQIYKSIDETRPPRGSPIFETGGSYTGFTNSTYIIIKDGCKEAFMVTLTTSQMKKIEQPIMYAQSGSNNQIHLA